MLGQLAILRPMRTGTELGDPIEVTGLTQAFQKDTSDTRFLCARLSQIEPGPSGSRCRDCRLCKIILQMKHGRIVPSLHARELKSEYKI